MAILLHIETATEQCSVALSDNATLLSQKSILDGGFKHAAKLHVFIDEILRQANISLSELDAVAVSAGPGSFTGLRIGSVAAKGLCFALDIPLITISTLQLLAAPHVQNAKVVALLDARRDEVYTATFDVGGKELSQMQAHILTETSFADLAHEPVCFVGTGAEKAQNILPENAHWQFLSTHPIATAMLHLATAAFEKKEFTDSAAFAPTYIKSVRITPSKKDALGRVM
ncbi:MAG: tRNA threonylcarbamoyladenosine biosynthesis protein TsaB [Bacteroidota bacterium]|nr:MAG: tRNA threonylcarbamoyladenosine biosynthesis protein TsaB [Bacteroidota bacterium]